VNVSKINDHVMHCLAIPALHAGKAYTHICIPVQQFAPIAICRSVTVATFNAAWSTYSLVHLLQSTSIIFVRVFA